jgi:hypothetical protein
MHRVWHFPALLGATLLSGALLAWPLFVLFEPLVTPNFRKLLTLGTLATGIAFALLYVRFTGPLNPAVLGIRWHERFSREPLAAFVCGLLLLGLIEACLLLIGVHEVQRNREYVRMYVAAVVVQAFVFGLVVAAIEELLFRGALLAGLLRSYGRAAAMILASATFALAHFLKYPDPLPGQELHWYTGLLMFPTALRWLASPGTPEALLTLFLFGMLLATLRLRRDSLWPCIGIHAGLAAGYRIATYFTDPVPGSEFEFLLSSNSPVLGWLAAAWMGLALLVCHRYCPPRAQEPRR